MKKQFIKSLFEYHRNTPPMPYRSSICELIERMREFLFPQFSEHCIVNETQIAAQYELIYSQAIDILSGMEMDLPKPAKEIADELFDALPGIHEMLKKDAEAIFSGDPASTSVDQVIRTYPGFRAIFSHRIAHELYRMKLPLLPRIISENAHSHTGIDIHPGAEIGEHFCIDHGTGIVIGETTKIGKNVKIYQGVTLGALSVDKSMAETKRHPTLEDHVVVYAGATILGGDTVIGEDSVIGGNVWLTNSVEKHSIVYHRPQIVMKNKKELMSKSS
ncbi:MULTISPECIES: serine O-acetyltransferase EpsC [Persicobacter]|uniref:Serine acetyltransferase n=1 Tax=Persicobacter diffluens TaxID=981 RepID=A0AAN5AJJ7_9BACT|nr:serine O-acetyltransferase EpsC [Persicobacter sp. CCB-QB2]GJM59531.1 serine acetyltransferase [Persicobacter diffluens]